MSMGLSAHPVTARSAIAEDLRELLEALRCLVASGKADVASHFRPG
jgi:hypothetical protein